ncbi:hypothetical protein [Pseudomonas sp. ATCC 13867]|uniref:hypothetical protein n=1 Tax=Pseudomonas sp. ATCC 13867 TaxID=1294143 RepID=UPI00138AD06A|nr:hypothetical protein [Pseudomonas sp. ATCC 13867]
MLLKSSNLNRLKLYLAYSPPRLWQALGADGSRLLRWTHRPQGLWRTAPTQWVIDRSQCLYRCLDFSHVPRAQRGQALAMKVSSLSAYRTPEYHAVWRGGHALLWMWDRQVRQALAQDMADAPRRYRCLPESLLQSPVEAVASPVLRLIQVMHGYDLQVWKQGVLLLSLHFREPPSLQQIRFATRGLAGLEVTTVPEVQRFEYLQAPWAAAGGPGDRAWERWVPHGLAAALVLGGTMEITQGVLSWSGMRELQSEHAQLVKDIEPLLDARSRTQRAVAQSQELQRRMQAIPTQIELMKRVAELLPPDSRLTTWRFDGRELALLINTTNMDPRFFVQRLQDEGHFHDVRVEPSPRGDGLQLAMSLN